MENQIQISKINTFLSLVTPVIAGVVRTILETLDFQFVEQGRGLELVFSIKKGERQADFYLQNLLLEIATIDRDENPLRFDEGLRDFDYFLAKTCRLIPSKLNILFQLLGEKDVDTAIEKISQAAKNYERIRIWKFDQNESSQSHHHK